MTMKSLMSVGMALTAMTNITRQAPGEMTGVGGGLGNTDPMNGATFTPAGDTTVGAPTAGSIAVKSPVDVDLSVGADGLGEWSDDAADHASVHSTGVL
jgi:hypothetical protein